MRCCEGPLFCWPSTELQVVVVSLAQVDTRAAGARPPIPVSAYKKTIGWPFAYPRNELGCTAIVLRMIFSLPTELHEVPRMLDDALQPKVAFYSDLIYRPISILTDVLPMGFALGRTPGRVAPWKEPCRDPERRLGRPRQSGVRKPKRALVPLDTR